MAHLTHSKDYQFFDAYNFQTKSSTLLIVYRTFMPYVL